MTRPLVLIRSVYLSIAVALTTALSLPLTAGLALADCTPPDTTSPGVHQPVGSDAAAFSYNCVTGMWESAHFIYDPNTGATTAKDDPVYTYNPATGQYDLTSWIYNAPTGSYIPYTTSVKMPPAGATVVGAPVAPSGGNSINNTGAGSNNLINNNDGVTNGSSINGTGPNSNNIIDGSGNNNTTLNANTTATMNNGLTATANSGNALVIGNTSAQGANSGNAQDIANIVNLLQSSSNALDGGAVTFVANIDGDVNGDLLFDPTTLGQVQPAAATGPSVVGNNNLTINNQLGAAINNDINLDATSGNATVTNNTTGGDATTGSAETIANVVNLINSAISSGRSFLGVVNINGNLNGDILIPPDFVDQLIASNVPTVTISNTGPNSNNAINRTGSGSTNVTNTNGLGITNNVDATAQSGSAAVTENTKGGSATSGTAGTSITAFNLTGSQVIGSNAMLVFVNVLGEWVGLIVNAPPGATAAALGGGLNSIGQTGPSSNNAINDQGSSNTTLDNNANLQINNNIRTAARSGNANVNRNTNGGNARSGNAKGAVNLANIENSTLGLTNWFGVLFINVFGTWHGSFGMDTAAGNPIARGLVNDGSPAGGVGSAFSTPGQTFAFVPTGQGSNFKAIPGGPLGSGSNFTNSGAGNSAQAVNAVLAANAIGNKQIPTASGPSAHSSFGRNAAIIGLMTAALVIGDALNERRRKAHATA